MKTLRIIFSIILAILLLIFIITSIPIIMFTTLIETIYLIYRLTQTSNDENHYVALYSLIQVNIDFCNNVINSFKGKN